MFLHSERIYVRIQWSGLILFQFQVNLDTALLFFWLQCFGVCGLSFASLTVREGKYGWFFFAHLGKL